MSKWILNNSMAECGLDSFGTRWGPVAGCSEHGNELLDSIQCWGGRQNSQGRDLTTHPLMPSSRMMELYFHSPICLHGIVLN
jgi:hypothetical protein